MFLEMKPDSGFFKALQAFGARIGVGELRPEKEVIYYYILDHPKRSEKRLIAYLDRLNRQIIIREVEEGYSGNLEDLPLVHSFLDPESSNRTIFPQRAELRTRSAGPYALLHYEGTVKIIDRRKENAQESSEIMDERVAIPFEQYERLKALFSEEDLPWEESYNE